MKDLILALYGTIVSANDIIVDDLDSTRYKKTVVLEWGVGSQKDPSGKFVEVTDNVEVTFKGLTEKASRILVEGCTVFINNAEVITRHAPVHYKASSISGIAALVGAEVSNQRTVPAEQLRDWIKQLLPEAEEVTASLEAILPDQRRVTRVIAGPSDWTIKMGPQLATLPQEAIQYS